MKYPPLYPASYRSEQRAAGLCDLPSLGIADDQRLTEDVQAGGARRQALRPIGPVGAATNEDRNRAFKVSHRQIPAGVTR